MSQLSVTIQNTSSKAIVKGGLTFLFPETRTTANVPIPVIVMGIGRPQKHALLRRDGTSFVINGELPKESRLEPGATLVLKATPDDANAMQTRAYELSAHLTRATVNLDSIYFEDESKWMLGEYYMAVPPPDLWRHVTPEEFVAGTAPEGK